MCMSGEAGGFCAFGVEVKSDFCFQGIHGELTKPETGPVLNTTEVLEISLSSVVDCLCMTVNYILPPLMDSSFLLNTYFFQHGLVF